MIARLRRGLQALRSRVGDVWARLRAKRREAPSPPRRLREETEVQLLRSREWTPEQWADFAATLAEGAYLDGYQRGVQEGVGLKLPAGRHDWSVWESPHMRRLRVRGGDLGDPLAGVAAKDAIAFADALGRHQGTYRVVDGAGRRVTADRSAVPYLGGPEHGRGESGKGGADP